MTKPTVFFSHSSADRRFLAALKDLFLARTGGAIDVFLSSDGQSIPLGRNWVHRIQESLEHAGLMLVFISPSSQESRWMHFEAGFAYSKGIRVVPIAILGLNLGALSPPLTLLQGFNLTSEDGLGNILALANEVFTHTHSTDFSKSDYKSLLSHAGLTVASVLGDHSVAIDNIHFTVRRSEDLRVTPLEAMSTLEAELQRGSASYQRHDDALRAFGLEASVNTKPHAEPLVIKIEPVLAGVTIPVVQSVLSAVLQNGWSSVDSLIKFRNGVGGVFDQVKITARLHGSDVALGATPPDLRFMNLHFEIGRRYDASPTYASAVPWLRIRPLDDVLTVSPLASLIDLLFDTGVFFYSTWNE
jgi:hypothetical protein